MGRPALTAGEMIRMEYAENLKKAYEIRAQSNWTVFANQNEYWAAQLFEAAELAHG